MRERRFGKERRIVMDLIGWLIFSDEVVDGEMGGYWREMAYLL